MKGDEDCLTTNVQEKRRKQEGSGLLKRQLRKAMGPQTREIRTRTHYSPLLLFVLSRIKLPGEMSS